MHPSTSYQSWFFKPTTVWFGNEVGHLDFWIITVSFNILWLFFFFFENSLLYILIFDPLLGPMYFIAALYLSLLGSQMDHFIYAYLCFILFCWFILIFLNCLFLLFSSLKIITCSFRLRIDLFVDGLCRCYLDSRNWIVTYSFIKYGYFTTILYINWWRVKSWK